MLARCCSAIAVGWLGLGLVVVQSTHVMAQDNVPGLRDGQEARLTPSLLASASYWRLHDQPLVALKDYQRILSFHPNDPDILAAAAELSFGLDDYDGGQRYRADLLRVAPNDRRNQALAAEKRRTPAETALLAASRHLASDRHFTEALASYKLLFKDRVPAGITLEYYGVLAASSPEGWDQAREALLALVEAAPSDPVVQLAYVRLLVQHEEYRNEGIRRLAALSQTPDAGKTARELWRQVLLWQGPSEKARSQIEAYLADNPSDPAIEAKLSSFDASLPDAGVRAIIRGYYSIESDPEKAEQSFNEALLVNPNNPDAMVMLAALKRKQGRPAEAQVLIDRAVGLAPERKAELLKSAGGEYTGLLPLNEREKLQIVSLTMQGDYNQAQSLLIRLYQGREQAPALIQLGGIQLLAREFGSAEVSFRRARVLSPRNGDAACGLATAIGRQGRYAEAGPIFASAILLYTGPGKLDGLRKIALAQASLVNAEAATLDAPSALALQQTRLAADPHNIYIRVDLAHALQAAGQDDQAASLLTAGVGLADGNPEFRQVALAASVKAANQQRIALEIRQAQSGSMQRALSIVPAKLTRVAQ